MAKVPNGVKKLLKISTACLGRTSVTDRRQTDGRQHIANVSSRSLKTGRLTLEAPPLVLVPPVRYTVL